SPSYGVINDFNVFGGAIRDVLECESLDISQMGLYWELSDKFSFLRITAPATEAFELLRGYRPTRELTADEESRVRMEIEITNSESGLSAVNYGSRMYIHVCQNGMHRSIGRDGKLFKITRFHKGEV